MLLDLQTIKDRFPDWQLFVADDDRLALRVANAERELARYVTPQAPLSDALDGLYLSLVKKHVFDERHGDTVFESRPQILRDYDEAVRDLKAVRARVLAGEIKPDGSGLDDLDDDSDALESKPRRFGTWFR